MKKPILRGAFAMRRSVIRVYCPYCNLFHDHKLDDKIYRHRPSLREAACVNPDSPFIESGYYVQLWGNSVFAQVDENKRKVINW